MHDVVNPLEQEDEELQRAIQESLQAMQNNTHTNKKLDTSQNNLFNVNNNNINNINNINNKNQEQNVNFEFMTEEEQLN